MNLEHMLYVCLALCVYVWYHPTPYQNSSTHHATSLFFVRVFVCLSPAAAASGWLFSLPRERAVCYREFELLGMRSEVSVCP